MWGIRRNFLAQDRGCNLRENILIEVTAIQNKVKLLGQVRMGNEIIIRFQTVRGKKTTDDLGNVNAFLYTDLFPVF